MKPMTLMAITAMSLGSLACKKTDTTAKNVKFTVMAYAQCSGEIFVANHPK